MITRINITLSVAFSLHSGKQNVLVKKGWDVALDGFRINGITGDGESRLKK